MHDPAGSLFRDEGGWCGQWNQAGTAAGKIDADAGSQAAHPDLTITDMYNVLEKLRKNEELTAKDRVIHEQGLAFKGARLEKVGELLAALEALGQARKLDGGRFAA